MNNLLTLVLPLAVKNLFRNVRRTLITSGAVVAGVTVLIIGWGIVGGLEENIIRGEEDTMAGHVLLRPAGATDDGVSWPIDETRVVDDGLATTLGEHTQVEAWTPRLFFTGRAVSGPDSVHALAVGYDPQTDPAVFPRDAWTITGAWPEGPNQVGVSSGMAKILGLSLGDDLILEANTRAGAVNALTYEITTIINTTNAQLDRLSVWMPMATAETLVRADGARSHVAVRLDGRRHADAFATSLTSPHWTAETARHRAKDKLALNEIRKKGISVVVLILMAIAATGIANTVTMAAFERVKEIGTLRALGFSKLEIGSMFVFEGAVLGLSAGLVGASLGSGLVYYSSLHGIDLGGVSDAMGGAVGTTILYLQLDANAVLTALGFGVGVAALASMNPAWYAANLNPADAVRAD